MLTFFQSQTILEALNRGKHVVNECGTDEDMQLMDKAIKHILNAIKDGMPIGEHEDDMIEESEPDQTFGAMRHSYAGLL